MKSGNIMRGEALGVGEAACMMCTPKFHFRYPVDYQMEILKKKREVLKSGVMKDRSQQKL